MPWNLWREENPDVQPDLREAVLRKANLWQANLNGADLSKANLWGAELGRARFREANLSEADLSETNLQEVDFVRANLRNANFRFVNLRRAGLYGADFRGVDLTGADLGGADLRMADFREANLIGANLIRTNLWQADLSGVSLDETVFANVDMSEVKGLEEVRHKGPSTVGMDTIQRSKGNVPEMFLRGCGLSDVEIEFAKLINPNLSNHEITDIQYRMYDLRATQAVQVAPLFISYSHADSKFVDAMEEQLNSKGIRFWRDIHDMKAGRVEKQIDRAIRQNPTVLLVLSKNSLESDWVEDEVHLARDLEKELRKDVLCPIALDDSWQSSRWPRRFMNRIKEYMILDFSAWEEPTAMRMMFSKLVDGLQIFYDSEKKKV